jgi:hypothetical protein
MDKSTPSPMTSSRLSPTPSVPAAAMGPGVGGMKQWLMYRPMESATVMATLLVPVRLTIALRMGFKMTKPLSQNTGMDTIQPMSSMASSGCFLPTSFTTLSAIFRAAPVFSSSVPTSAPKMMTMPMLLNVPLNPAPITSAMPSTAVPSAAVYLYSGMPAISPKINATPMMERNGCTLNLLMATIITTIARMNTIISPIPVMVSPPYAFWPFADLIIHN